MTPPSTHNPLQRRLAAFGLNMIVMAVSFALYFLGFFGGVEGPLNMDRIGRGLAELGFTSDGFQGLLVTFFVLALTWNWILNLIAHLAGQRLTCTQFSPELGFCGELVRRSRQGGSDGRLYTCPRGHRRHEARFHPLRKGRAADTLLLVSLVCALMYYFS